MPTAVRQSRQLTPIIDFAKYIRKSRRNSVTLEEYREYKHKKHQDLTKTDELCIISTRIDNEFLTFTYMRNLQGNVVKLYRSRL